MKEGVHKTYYDNGNLKTTGNYKDGMKEGVHETYYEGSYSFSGRLKSSENYIEGKLNGLSEFWTSRGHLKFSKNFKDGILID